MEKLRDAHEPEHSHVVHRWLLLIGVTAALLFGFGAMIESSLPQVSPPSRKFLMGLGIFYLVAPFGVLAFHVLVHRGSLGRRLLLAIPTTLAAYVLAIALLCIVFPPSPM